MFYKTDKHMEPKSNMLEMEIADIQLSVYQLSRSISRLIFTCISPNS